MTPGELVAIAQLGETLNKAHLEACAVKSAHHEHCCCRLCATCHILISDLPSLLKLINEWLEDESRPTETPAHD